MPATTHVTIQWLKEHRHENNRFLTALGVAIISVAALFALAEVARVGIILAWAALALLALALPWTDWVSVWTRDTDTRAWHTRDAAGSHYRPPNL